MRRFLWLSLILTFWASAAQAQVTPGIFPGVLPQGCSDGQGAIFDISINRWNCGNVGGSGAVSTDSIWDVAGDTVYGTGANTAGRLAIGTALQLYRVNAGATAPEWWTLAITSALITDGEIVNADLSATAAIAWSKIASDTLANAFGRINNEGTGVVAALGVNIGSAGAMVLFNGALGTPSSGTLTSVTGLPPAGVTFAASDRLLCRDTASGGAGEECTTSAALAMIGATQGNVLYHNGTSWVVLAPGTDGFFLQAKGAGANPVWAASTGSVATDAIFDAAGDLVQGTGANTSARLPVGTAAQVLRVNAGATAAEWWTVAIALGSQVTGDLPFANLTQCATGTVLSNLTGGTADVLCNTYADFLAAAGVPTIAGTPAQGNIIFRGAAGWELLAVGTNGKVLTTHGAAADPTWETGGSGDVLKVSTPSNNQCAVWTGDGTLEGTSDCTYDGTSLNLITGKNFQIAGATVLSDAAGTTTLDNIDALGATTESTIEAAIDTLANLTSIQAHTVTLTGDFIRVGAHSLTITTSGTTSVTFPTSGTLQTTAGSLASNTALPPAGVTFAASDRILCRDTASGGVGEECTAANVLAMANLVFSGPTVPRTYTLPDANATILYSGGALGTPASGTLNLSFHAVFLAGNCQNATASSGGNLPTTLGAAGGCQGTTAASGDPAYGTAVFVTGGANTEWHGNFPLPSDWTGAIDVVVTWVAASATGNDVVFQAKLGCTAAGQAPTSVAFDNTTMTASTNAGSLLLNKATKTGLTASTCAAGEHLFFIIDRDTDTTGDTLDVDVQAISIDFTYRRAVVIGG